MVRLMWLACAGLLLAACGGGDEEGSKSTGEVVAPNPTPEPPPGSGPDPDPEPDPTPEPPANRPPTLSGTPGGVATIGSLYTFTPSASDPDGDPLTFHVQNAPSWAEFDASTGQLSGTPGTDDAGTYANIVIGVSDGEATVAMSPFSIVVSQAEENSAIISWTPPTENTDGSALENLAGYTIVYGNSPDVLHQSIRIDNPSINTYVIENLTAGTYYFGVRAYTTEDIESPLSNVVSKVIQ
ncbi:MAG TPA: putative Ig domain-containing protein [Steroidobacter sp.]